MKKIPIDEAPAGPEMDAAIARALGCNVTIGKREGRQAAFCNCESREHENPITYVSRMLKRYSQDIEAAWELVEWLHQRIDEAEDGNPDALPFALAWYQRLRLEFGRKTGWWASFDARNIKGIEPSFLCIAETARLAICRAFLKANGIEYIEVPE